MNPTRSLLITNKSIFPAIGGAALRNLQTLHLLQKLGPVATFSVVSRATSWGEAPPGVALWRHHQPAKMTPAALLVRELWWLRSRGHRWSDGFHRSAIEADLRAVLDEFQPDLVVLEEPWLHGYAELLRERSAALVYDAHNVEALVQREGDGASLPRRMLSRFKLGKVRAIEQYLIHAADQVWACSDGDARALQALYGPALEVRVVPNAVDVAQYGHLATIGSADDAPVKRSDGCTLIYTATFGYQPNAVAARVLIDDVLPRLRRKLPGCRLLLVGNQPTSHMLAAAQRDHDVIVTGRVPDVRPYMAAADVAVVPLLEGGGTRLKILEAFAARLPVVSTAKGAEGLAVEDGRHLLLRDEMDAFADAVVTLYGNPELRAALVARAYDLVAAHYSWDAICASVECAVRDALPARRNRAHRKTDASLGARAARTALNLRAALRR